MDQSELERYLTSGCFTNCMLRLIIKLTIQQSQIISSITLYVGIYHSILRCSHRNCSARKVVPRNLEKFSGKHLCQSLFFNIGLRPATLLKKRCFPVNFAKFQRTPFLQNSSGRLLLHATHLLFIMIIYIFILLKYQDWNCKTNKLTKYLLITAFARLHIFCWDKWFISLINCEPKNNLEQFSGINE